MTYYSASLSMQKNGCKLLKGKIRNEISIERLLFSLQPNSLHRDQELQNSDSVFYCESKLWGFFYIRFYARSIKIYRKSQSSSNIINLWAKTFYFLHFMNVPNHSLLRKIKKSVRLLKQQFAVH